MGACEHWHIAPSLSIVVQLLNELFKQGDICLIECLFNGQRHRGVVDVLGSKAEVDEILEGVYIGFTRRAQDVVETLLDEILDSLNIMIRDSLNILNTAGIVLREIQVDVAQLGKEVMGESGQLRQRQFAQCDEILNLYPYTVADECILREKLREGSGLSTVAAVNRRNGCQG